jgi:transcriptional regulator with XRE-family HTH domain
MSHTSEPSFGQALIRYRERRKLDLTAAAELVGVSVGKLSAWEIGREYPDTASLAHLAGVYGLQDEDTKALHDLALESVTRDREAFAPDAVGRMYAAEVGTLKNQVATLNSEVTALASRATQLMDAESRLRDVERALGAVSHQRPSRPRWMAWATSAVAFGALVVALLMSRRSATSGDLRTLTEQVEKTRGDLRILTEQGDTRSVSPWKPLPNLSTTWPNQAEVKAEARHVGNSVEMRIWVTSKEAMAENVALKIALPTWIKPQDLASKGLGERGLEDVGRLVLFAPDAPRMTMIPGRCFLEREKASGAWWIVPYVLMPSFLSGEGHFIQTNAPHLEPIDHWRYPLGDCVELNLEIRLAPGP